MTKTSATTKFGLKFFTEARNTAVPNDIRPVHSFTPLGAEVDIDFVLSPKGTGGISAQVADGTVIGGNKRGTNSVDLQMKRLDANQVVSGSYSFAAGLNNRVAEDVSATIGRGNVLLQGKSLALGVNNTTAGSYSMCFGYSNTAGTAVLSDAIAMGSYSNALGAGSTTIGKKNTITALGKSSVAIGSGNTVSQQDSTAIGYKITVSGRASLGLGYSSSVSGSWGAASVGAYNIVAGDYACALGTHLRTSAVRAIVIGTGANINNRLHNTVHRSIWFGVNATVPTMAIWNAGGVGKFGSVSIGSATETPNVIFDVVSTLKASRPIPSMTTAERDLIPSPLAGMQVYNTTTNALNVYTTSWGAVVNLSGLVPYSGAVANLELGANSLFLGEPHYVDNTPPMTSNVFPPPLVASASSEFGGSYNAFAAFDGLTTSGDGWFTVDFVVVAWLKLDLGAGNSKIIRQYKLTSSGGYSNSMAKNWTFEGSNDDFVTAGVVLDTHVNAPVWGQSETRAYTISNAVAYRYYRIDVTANQGDLDYLAIGEMDLLELLNPTTVLDVASTTKASRPTPSMTTAQRDAIPTPLAGMQVYNTNTNALNIYTTSWGTIGLDITRSIASIAVNTVAPAVTLTDYVYICTATLTLTLPTAVGNTNLYTVKNIAGITTVDCNGAQTIDGSSTAVLSVANTSLTLVSNNSNWLVI